MGIRLKIIFIVLPVLIAAVVLAGMSSYFVAASSVTRVAVDFLDFKASGVETYAESQWNLLVENGFVGRPEMEEAARAAVEAYARSVLRSSSETILAIEPSGAVAMRAGPGTPSPEDTAALAALAKDAKRGFLSFKIGGIDRVASAVRFAPFNWLLLVTEERKAFYGDVETIARTSLAILAGASFMAIILLLFLANYLTKPIQRVVSAMQHIIASNDLTERVPVEYKDEIGRLSHTFNLMIGELETAYSQIKNYAFDAVVAQKREMKIRNIFQLYVPKDVIEQVFMNPEKMLVGDNRDVAILFSDIRGFTTISEGMAPDVLVASLNRYFSMMVDVIMARNGMVDKYIGDAIMAVFGAPLARGDDVLSSVLAGLEMTETLDTFNAEQRASGSPEFHIGVGINYGEVTVGNIGCEKKMNYTVIGDMVNLASRLEGLTKKYHEPILITESVRDGLKGALPCRVVDTVAVKGKTKGVKILTTRRKLSSVETETWAIHEEALSHYYKRDFSGAAALLERILKLKADDYAAKLFLDRSHAFIASPPPKTWDGVEIMTEK
ncbi:MAG: adenylate/guanylate cyclase domain-containing protein [Treponemataceae bacterium]